MGFLHGKYLKRKKENLSCLLKIANKKMNLASFFLSFESLPLHKPSAAMEMPAALWWFPCFFFFFFPAASHYFVSIQPLPSHWQKLDSYMRPKSGAPLQSVIRVWNLWQRRCVWGLFCDVGYLEAAGGGRRSRVLLSHCLRFEKEMRSARGFTHTGVN